MPAFVQVSSIDTIEKVRMHIEGLFKKRQYAEITLSIGMHSILIDPEHTMRDQRSLYRLILDMIKARITGEKGKGFGAWYQAFPKLMEELGSSKQVVTDKAAQEVIVSHRDAYGAFKSVDDFFFWALDDRKLPLDQIVKYIEKTTEMRPA